MRQVPRPHKRKIAFSAVELADLQARASLVGRPFARYVRETALGVLPVIEGRRIDNSALAEWRRIGNNLNQLAREANVAERFPSEAEINAVLDELMALAAKFGGTAR